VSAIHSTADVLRTLGESDRFLVQQVFKPIANEYRISLPPPGTTEEGPPLLFVRQKRMAIREDIRFRTDPDQDAHVFMIKSKTVFEFAGRHDVLDEHGSVIGTLEKSFGRSLLRSHWVVRDAVGTEVLGGEEKSLVIALIRRFAGLIPVAGAELLQYLPFDFVLSGPDGSVGHYRRVLGTFRDRYVLELGPVEGIDRRLLIALAVALDALQDR
jgi:uncharacterized protein YxjI